MVNIAKMTDTSREAVERKLDASASEKKVYKSVKKSPASTDETAHKVDHLQNVLLAVAFGDERVQELFKDIEPGIFRGADRQAAAEYVKKHAGKQVTSIPSSLQEYEKYVTMLLLHPDVDSVEWNGDHRVATATETIRKLQANYQKTNTKEELLSKEAAAREQGDDAAADGYLRELNALIRGER